MCASRFNIGVASLNINREAALCANDLVTSLLSLSSTKAAETVVCLQDCSSWPHLLRLHDSRFIIFSGEEGCRVRTIMHFSRSRRVTSVVSGVYFLSILFSDMVAVHNMYLPDTGIDARSRSRGDSAFFSAIQQVESCALGFRSKGARFQIFCGDCNIHLNRDDVVAGPAASARIPDAKNTERMNALRSLAVNFGVRSDLTWSQCDACEVTTRWPWVWDKAHTQIDHVFVPACATSVTRVLNSASFGSTDHFPVLSAISLPVLSRPLDPRVPHQRPNPLPFSLPSPSSVVLA